MLVLEAGAEVSEVVRGVASIVLEVEGDVGVIDVEDVDGVIEVEVIEGDVVVEEMGKLLAVNTSLVIAAAEDDELVVSADALVFIVEDVTAAEDILVDVTALDDGCVFEDVCTADEDFDAW